MTELTIIKCDNNKEQISAKDKAIKAVIKAYGRTDNGKDLAMAYAIKDLIAVVKALLNDKKEVDGIEGGDND